MPEPSDAPSMARLLPARTAFTSSERAAKASGTIRRASYDFLILAPFYKTGAFFVAVAMALAAMSWLLYRYRLQQVAERIRLRMQAQNDERLRIAQAMHRQFFGRAYRGVR